MKGFLQKLFNFEETPSVTIVSGLPRSGTSMLMKMLEAGGLPPLTDNIRTADTDNPKGYYEFERVKKLDKGDTAWLPQAEGKAVKVISALLEHLPDDHTYRIIFIRRNMPEILASQRKMLVNRGEDPNKVDEEKMAALFAKHLAKTETWLAQQPNIDVLYVHYTDLITEPKPNAAQIKAFLGSDLDVEKMTAVVDPDLYRNRQAGLGQSS